MNPEDIMKRPSEGDDYVRRRAAEMMLPRMKAYLGPDAADYTEKELLADLAKYMSGGDGFEIVKSMERSGGWVGDSDLVELMDDSRYVLSDAVRELTKQWVICTKPNMPHSLGDLVVADHWSRKGQFGVVAKVDEELAEYGVHYPDQKEKQWNVFFAEKVSAAPVSEVAHA